MLFPRYYVNSSLFNGSGPSCRSDFIRKYLSEIGFDLFQVLVVGFGVVAGVSLRSHLVLMTVIPFVYLVGAMLHLLRYFPPPPHPR